MAKRIGKCAGKRTSKTYLAQKDHTINFKIGTSSDPEQRIKSAFTDPDDKYTLRGYTTEITEDELKDRYRHRRQLDDKGRLTEIYKGFTDEELADLMYYFPGIILYNRRTGHRTTATFTPRTLREHVLRYLAIRGAIISDPYYVTITSEELYRGVIAVLFESLPDDEYKTVDDMSVKGSAEPRIQLAIYHCTRLLVAEGLIVKPVRGRIALTKAGLDWLLSCMTIRQKNNLLGLIQCWMNPNLPAKLRRAVSDEGGFFNDLVKRQVAAHVVKP